MQRKTSRFGLVLSVLLTAWPVAADKDFGDWSAPVNLGSVINSMANDEAPAISNDGLSLTSPPTGPATRTSGWPGAKMRMTRGASQ